MKTLILLSCCLLNFTAAYNYLVVNAIFGYSHSKFIASVADVIAEAGHKVTVFQIHHTAMKDTHKMLKNKNIEVVDFYPDNYEEILNAQEVEAGFVRVWESMAMSSPAVTAFALPRMMEQRFNNTGTQLFKNKKILEDLRARNFDAVVAETFEISGFYIAHLINRPPLAILSCVRFAVQHLFGQPSSVGYVPGDFSKQGASAGFFDRLNDVYQHYFYSMFNNGMMEKQHQIYKKAIGQDDLPHWTKLITRSPFVLANSNSFLDFAIPVSRNVIPIGGFTINSKKDKAVQPLPEEYEKILSQKDATILISFGSVARSYQMPDSFKAGVISMFKALPEVSFIWKYEKEDADFQKSLPPNVHLKKWLPQPALLADKRVKLFITHGGLGSTIEVAYSAKPALMIPLFGDQPENAMMLARHGGAVAFYKFDLRSEQKLAHAVKDMITNPSYQEKATELANVLHNQPIDPKEILIKHLEFGVKFPHFKSQTPEILSAGFIGYYYIDIYLFAVFVLFTVLYLSFVISRAVFRKLTKSSEKSKDE